MPSKQPRTSTPKAPSPMKSVPRKVVKVVKRIFSHKHVTHEQALSVSAIVPGVLNVVQSGTPPLLTFPSSPRSGYSRDTFIAQDDSVTHKEADLASVSNSNSTTSSSRRLSSLTSTSSSQQSTAVSAEGLPVELLPFSPSLERVMSIPMEGEPRFPSLTHIAADPNQPDPFFMDEEEANDSSEDDARQPPKLTLTESQQTIHPAEEISLAASPNTPSAELTPTAHLPPNLNKETPPKPESEPEEEEKAPDLYLPGLVIPSMFLPIPNTDPLTSLLTKYIYPAEKRPVRDLSGEWQRTEFHTLVMTNSWRALARMARDRLVTTDAEEVGLILNLWSLRLLCLARLRLFNQTAVECNNLFTVLNAIEPLDHREYVMERLLPFELEVMNARLRYWAGDHMGYLDALNGALNKCKMKARQAQSDWALAAMWKERGMRICLIIASHLLEMKDLAGAAKLLEPLCNQGHSVPAIDSMVARVYLQSGNLEMAARHIAKVEADPTAEPNQKALNAALFASAEGDWAHATDVLRGILEADAENYAAINDLSVALLYQGKLKEAIEVMEVALNSSPSSVVVAEPFLFNLSTLYELRSATAAEKKKDLLVKVAAYSGDGLRATCLKMPSN